MTAAQALNPAGRGDVYPYHRGPAAVIPVTAAAAPPPHLAPRAGDVTLKDVAALARVHPATASRALHSATRRLVRGETASRVLTAARDLGYLPNQPAASLRTRRTCTVGVLLADLGDPLAALLARGAEDCLAAADYLPVIRSTGGDRTGGLTVVSQLRAHHTDGLILAAGKQNAPLAASAGARLPVVWAGRVPAGCELPAAAADYALGMHMIMDCLAGAGHRVIGRVTGPGAPVSQEDLACAAAAAGLAAPACLARTGKVLSAVEGRRCARSILATRPACTAIVTSNDMLAAGCCRAVAEAGLACPQDISVTGFGDLPLAGSLHPPLTTVRLPQHRVGTAAAQLLLGLLGGPASPARTVLVPPKLITRRSSGPPPTVAHS